jgi:hyaluronan synthase/N-acetylglucosaminyltransferase
MPKYSEYKAKCSILIPTYNEPEEKLEACIAKIIGAKGNNEIIVIDDCSTNNSWGKIKELKKKFPRIKAIKLKRNKGKRIAQYWGLSVATGDIIATIDSDTLVDEDAIIELLKPFNDPRVGATTGNIRALNRKQNLLTKMIDARYLSAFTFERRALSAFGIVTCCSGVLSAYRRSVLEEIKSRYVSQRFLGKASTYGDDRHLTNLILKLGYKILYVHSALAYTEVPSTLRSYFKQQLRWKKSFIRESLITLSYSLKRNKILFLETFYGLVIPFFSLAARVFIVGIAILYPITIIPIGISIVIIAMMRNMLIFFEEGSAALYLIPYAFLHELVLYWLYWYALFTLHDTRWGTR